MLLFGLRPGGRTADSQKNYEESTEALRLAPILGHYALG